MLIIARHGRTDANARGLLLGRADPDLDHLGVAQAQALAAAVGPVDRVLSSPLVRCRSTAACFNTLVEIDERWIELDYGDYDGKPASEVPVELWRRWRHDLSYAPPHGESLAALGERVREALASLADDARERHVVVVTHVSPIKAALAWALGAGDDIAWRAFVAPASTMRVAMTERGPVLHNFNDTSHLAAVVE